MHILYANMIGDMSSYILYKRRKSSKEGNLQNLVHGTPLFHNEMENNTHGFLPHSLCIRLHCCMDQLLYVGFVIVVVVCFVFFA